MLKLEKGGVYKVGRFRSGRSDRGPWEVITVKSEDKARQELTIFPSAVPSGLYEGCHMKIVEIKTVTRKKKKDANGNWTLNDVCLDAEVELVPEEDYNLDGDLPFTFGAYDDDSDTSNDLDGLLGSNSLDGLL